MSLWNPRKPLNQPPHFGTVGAVQASPVTKFDDALHKAQEALYDAKVQRSKRAGSRSTVFDRGSSGSR
ncbi:hypothetical protein [Acidovorax sp.]|uniref:hypothetical protein n=1 Tax=Acidovorax sp. TaxID=1872122 RepID=UPI0025BF7A65|nr:hypothetical protein [Acidovorax sp.]MBL7091713.1 hypothetical protein [Acidovorax sp.]